MKRIVALASFGAVFGLAASFTYGQEIETFDSPNPQQIGNSNFAFSPPIQGSFSPGAGGVITDNPTNVEIANPNGAYGTAYKSIYSDDTPPPGAPGDSIDISGSTMLQLDVTINSGDAGLFIDLTDGEQDEAQYFYGYGLVGGAANNGPPQSPGETISQGADPNELILDVPLATPHAYYPAAVGDVFDLTSIVNFRVEDDPGTAPSYDVSFNDLSAVNVPEPTSLGLVSVAAMLVTRRRRRV